MSMQNRGTIKSMLSKFSLEINQALVNLTMKLSQIAQQQQAQGRTATSIDTSAQVTSRTRGGGTKSNYRAKSMLETIYDDDEDEDIRKSASIEKEDSSEEEQEEEEDYGDSSNGDEDADEDNKDPGNSNNMASPSRSSGGEKQGNDILLIKI